MSGKSSVVFWIAGGMAAVVMICATVLVVTNHMSGTDWTAILSGLVTPIIMTILGIQNSQQSVQIDLLAKRAESIEDKVNGNISELIAKVPSASEGASP